MKNKNNSKTGHYGTGKDIEIKIKLGHCEADYIMIYESKVNRNFKNLL